MITVGALMTCFFVLAAIFSRSCALTPSTASLRCARAFLPLVPWNCLSLTIPGPDAVLGEAGATPSAGQVRRRPAAGGPLILLRFRFVRHTHVIDLLSMLICCGASPRAPDRHARYR